ncbi:MAG: CopG family transcriptional regulator [Nitrospirota bacterium]
MKTLLSEKRTQVYFPMDIYRRIEKKAKEESRSSAAIIREAVEEYLKKEKEIDWENDPFFKAAGFIKSDVTDMSVNHDAYIYGGKKVKIRKR